MTLLYARLAERARGRARLVRDSGTLLRQARSAARQSRVVQRVHAQPGLMPRCPARTHRPGPRDSHAGLLHRTTAIDRAAKRQVSDVVGERPARPGWAGEAVLGRSAGTAALVGDALAAGRYPAATALPPAARPASRPTASRNPCQRHLKTVFSFRRQPSENSAGARAPSRASSALPCGGCSPPGSPRGVPAGHRHQHDLLPRARPAARHRAGQLGIAFSPTWPAGLST